MFPWLHNTTTYVVLACSAVVAVLVLGGYLFSEMEPTLPPPDRLSEQLTSGPPETQVRAARDLLRHGPAARREVRQALEQSANSPPEVRMALIEAAQNIQDWRSMPAIFEAMEHPDPEVRGRAGAAARKIMGVDVYFRANDPPAKRAKAIAELRKEFSFKHKYHVHYSDQQE